MSEWGIHIIFFLISIRRDSSLGINVLKLAEVEATIKLKQNINWKHAHLEAQNPNIFACRAMMMMMMMTACVAEAIVRL